MKFEKTILLAALWLAACTFGGCKRGPGISINASWNRQFSEHGTILAVSTDDQTLCAYNYESKTLYGVKLNTGEVIWTSSLTESPEFLCYLKNGNLIVKCSVGNKLSLVDGSTGDCIRIFEPAANFHRPRLLEASAQEFDGRLLFCTENTDDSSIVEFDTTTGNARTLVSLKNPSGEFGTLNSLDIYDYIVYETCVVVITKREIALFDRVLSKFIWRIDGRFEDDSRLLPIDEKCFAANDRYSMVIRIDTGEQVLISETKGNLLISCDYEHLIVMMPYKTSFPTSVRLMNWSDPNDYRDTTLCTSATPPNQWVSSHDGSWVVLVNSQGELCSFNIKK